MRSLLFGRQSQQSASRLLFIFENLNKTIGYLRNLVVSWVIGFGILSDLYFLAFSLASAVSSIITGALSATFIPYSQKLGSCDRRRLLGGTALATSGLFLLVVVPIVVVMLATASPALRSEASTTTGFLITAGIILGFVGIQLLQVADEFNRSRRNFLLGGLLLVIVNIAAVVLLRYGVGITPVLLGWATALPSLLAVGWLFGLVRMPRWGWQTAVPYLRQTSPLMLSGSIGMVNVFIDRWFAAGFDAGRLSLMQTALMLVTQIGAAVVSPLINSAYPYFSIAYVNGEFPAAHAAVAQLEDRILAVSYAFVTAFTLLGHWGLSLIYQHGAVHAKNIDALYELGCWYMPVFIYGSMVTLYLRVLYCRGEIRLPALLSMLIIVVNIGLNLFFVDTWGWRALAGAASFSAWLYYSALVMTMYVRKDYPLRPSRFVLMNVLPFVLLIGSLRP